MSLFTKVDPAYFFGNLAPHDIADVHRRMVVICVGFCQGVCDLQLALLREVFVRNINKLSVPLDVTSDVHKLLAAVREP